MTSINDYFGPPKVPKAAAKPKTVVAPVVKKAPAMPTSPPVDRVPALNNMQSAQFRQRFIKG